MHTANSPVGFNLTLRAGQSDYAACAGTYLRMLDDINDGSILLLRGKPIYYSQAQNRIIFFTGSNFVITSASNYLVTIINGALGGFYGSQTGTSPFEDIWVDRYDVSSVH